MIDVRPYHNLGGGHEGWLNTRHHFSFAGYHDPKRMDWGGLRVWSDDEIASPERFPAASAPQHGDHHLCPQRRDHASGQSRQSRPHRGRGCAGDEAGTGIAMRNIISSAPTKIFQIWIKPARTGEAPCWGARPFPKAERAGRFVTLASGFAG